MSYDAFSQEQSTPAPTPAKPVPTRPAEKPSPDKKLAPGRPSPRPGERPRPVTEPKNFLGKLESEYYHTLPDAVKNMLSGTSPFSQDQSHLVQFEKSLLLERSETLHRLSKYPVRKKMRELPDEIARIEKGREKLIIEIVDHYIAEVLGPLHRTIDQKLDIAWKNPYDTKNERFSDSRVDQTQNAGVAEKEGGFDTNFVRQTISRSEIYYLLTQGFGILYMDGFFRMMRREISSVHADLPDLYDEYHLSGHATHHKVFAEVMSGIQLPAGIDARMESQSSEGRVWHTTEPVVDQESGNILEINTRSYARAEMGVILAHEALKGAFQILTPWARLNENYLRDSEMAVVRSALNSYWAEIRQFSLGPSFFISLQKTLESISVKTQLTSSEFYLAIQNLILADPVVQNKFLSHLFSGLEFDRKQADFIRGILLKPLDAP